MTDKVKINHWRYEDGWFETLQVLRKPGDPEREFREDVAGWHCWAYCNDQSNFIDWMEANCPASDCTLRFNSGDPMITVHITDPNEAMIFALRFGVKC